MADWQAANPVYGRTNNPWNVKRTCGGSSGGGAAVAAGFSALDIGSDIGGSVRVPAAFCGVYGLRPSETLVPRSGQYPIPPKPNWGAVLGAQGPLAKSAQDIEQALRVLAGPDVGEDRAWRVQLPRPRCTSLKGARVAVLPVIDFAPVDESILEAQHRIVEGLARAGALIQVAQPNAMGDWRAHYQLYLRLLHYMMSPRWGDDTRQEAIGRLGQADDEFAAAQIEGLRCTGAQLFGWHLQRENYRAAWRAFFADFDVLVTPTFHTAAFEHVEFDGPALGYGATLRTVAVNHRHVPYSRGLFYPHLSTLAGQPALAIPSGLNAQGLPLSVQLIGPYLEDLTLTKLAHLMRVLVDPVGPAPL
jgi:amidase